MSNHAFLAMMLDAPMQSWGFSSRFQRRTTAMHPTKIGILGMICAAMGVAKGSSEEKGMLKSWFIEPRPNVFVGTVNRRTREKTMEYIKRNGADAGFLVIHSDNNCQGFKIENLDPGNRKGVEIGGLYLIAEKWESESVPQDIER